MDHKKIKELMITVNEVSQVNTIKFNPDFLRQRVLEEAKNTLDKNGKPYSDAELRVVIQRIAQDKINLRTPKNIQKAVPVAIAQAMEESDPSMFLAMYQECVGEIKEKEARSAAENSQAMEEEASSQVTTFLSHYYGVAFYKKTGLEIQYLKEVVKNPDLLLPTESNDFEKKTV